MVKTNDAMSIIIPTNVIMYKYADLTPFHLHTTIQQHKPKMLVRPQPARPKFYGDYKKLNNKGSQKESCITVAKPPFFIFFIPPFFILTTFLKRNQQ